MLTENLLLPIDGIDYEELRVCSSYNGKMAIIHLDLNIEQSHDQYQLDGSQTHSQEYSLFSKGRKGLKH